MRFFGFLAMLLLISSLLPAESLWDSNSGGYVTAQKSLVIGQTVIVSIDQESTLKLTSGWSDSGSATFQMSGGEAGGLFDFLPVGTSQVSRTLKGESELAMTAEIATRVKSIDEHGTAFIEGTKTRTIGGNVESVHTSGWIQPSFVDAGGRIPFDFLSDSKIEYRTFNEPGDPVLTSEDFEQILESLPEGDITEPIAESEGAAGTMPTTAPATGALTAVETRVESSVSSLTPEAKQRLLLAYINRFLEMLFESETQETSVSR